MSDYGDEEDEKLFDRDVRDSGVKDEFEPHRA